MEDLKNFASAISQICEEKEISAEKVIETIETALAAAYKKDYGKKGQMIKAKLDQKTGQATFWQVKLVVDDSMLLSEEEIAAQENELPGEKEEEGEKKVRFNEDRHIMIEDAKEVSPDIKVGEELEISLEPKESYGRIAAQTAKQVILQKIKEAERETILNEFKEKEGEIVSGVVQRIEGKNVLLDVGKTLGILPREEQVPGEFYRPGQRLKVYLLRTEETSKGPVIFLSRAYPKLLSKLFELEVPEIAANQVVIKMIAREPGSRSKIAVMSQEEGIDPIGSAVGQRGSRVMAVISELGGEKIDIVEYSDDIERFIANSLSPAKVIEVKVFPRNRAIAVVSQDQLSLAIGRDGQNVRLAAKLTGWKIDVRSPESIEAEGIDIEDEEEPEVVSEEVVVETEEKEPENGKKDEKSDTKETKKKSRKKATKKSQPKNEDK
ncbi:MAG: transcription termination factor NusA [bacterium]